MSDYRVYDARGARARSRSVTPRRERARPSREAVMERGRRIKRASRRVALLCFAAFAVLAGLRAGPSASSPSAAQQLRHHRARRHEQARLWALNRPLIRSEKGGDVVDRLELRVFFLGGLRIWNVFDVTGLRVGLGASRSCPSVRYAPALMPGGLPGARLGA